MSETRLATSEQEPRSRERCTVGMPNGWHTCDQLANHAGPHTIWLTGFGPWQWPNKEQAHV